jgi:hypothetical protein
MLAQGVVLRYDGDLAAMDRLCAAVTAARSGGAAGPEPTLGGAVGPESTLGGAVGPESTLGGAVGPGRTLC